MPVGAPEQSPVDPPDVVARRVRAMLGEVHRHAEMRRPMEPGEKPFDHRARDELQIPDP
jgi:hypothetical protein